MLAGLALGSPTLRLRGDYLAIVTLGFGEIIRVTANNLESLGGPRGINEIPRPPSVPGVEALTFSVLNVKAYYYLIVAFIVVIIILLKRLENSRVGRSWAAIREDEDAAELMGVPTLTFKLWAFTVGAGIGGAAGVIYASFQTAIRPADFPFILSATILAAVVLGGAGHIPGVILGAFLVAWLPEVSREFSQYRVLVFGAVLVRHDDPASAGPVAVEDPGCRARRGRGRDGQARWRGGCCAWPSRRGRDERHPAVEPGLGDDALRRPHGGGLPESARRRR